jgi:nicotinate phosphoribosyltransferase
MFEKTNLTMLTDFYEITMANGYFDAGLADDIATFDMFFRKIPDGGGFAIMAGVEQLIEYMESLRFTEEDLVFLKRKMNFDQRFLDYLRDFKFACDVWAVPEGTPVFPGEPLVTVRGPVIQAQYVETMVLLIINHQSLIATKANRIVRAAKGRSVMEFGTRRAHGVSAAVYGSRAAYLAGCVGTACTVSERDYGIKAMGTMAHSWVQMFDNELTAFRKYAEIYPDNCVLLVDTYDVLKSGVPAAIQVFLEMNPHRMGIRIDSGDVTYLTKHARRMLDDAGLFDCEIVVSNSLDEYIIRDVISEGACIDSFGVGERLITAKSEPVFGGVYKLAALEKDGAMLPKMKLSENIEKITNPGVKTLYRFYDKSTRKCLADLIALSDEPVPSGEQYVIFDEIAPWKTKTLTNYTVEDLRVQLFDKGRKIYESPSIDEIKEHCAAQINTLWDEMLRFDNPQTYYVDISRNLWEMKNQLIIGIRKRSAHS